MYCNTPLRISIPDENVHTTSKFLSQHSLRGRHLITALQTYLTNPKNTSENFNEIVKDLLSPCFFHLKMLQT